MIFDLDGVLVDTKDMHFEALNKALIEHNYPPISYEDHLSKYNGLPTLTKLKMLGAPEEIAQTKQKYTSFDNVKEDKELAALLTRLAEHNMLCVASNSIRSSILTALKNLGVGHLFLFIRSNEDVVNPKPDPEIYNELIDHFPMLHSVIFEDSPIGLKAAWDSRASDVIKIQNRDHLVKVLNEYINSNGW